MNDLPSPKTDRRKRLGLRFTVLVLAVAILGAAYLFTRTPELVWWTSPPLGDSGHHVRVLVPQGWKTISPIDPGTETVTEWRNYWRLVPIDTRPAFLRWMHR